MKFSNECKSVVKAIYNVKKKLGSVAKTSNNPFFKSKYADLNAHLDVAEPLLEEYGCFVTQGSRFDSPTGATLGVTRIVHADTGEYVETEMRLVLSKDDMQTLGAALTYSRRFNLSALLAMKAEDDDGNTASNRVVKQSESEKSLGFSATTPKVEQKAATPLAQEVKKGTFKRPSTTPAVKPATTNDSNEDLI